MAIPSFSTTPVACVRFGRRLALRPMWALAATVLAGACAPAHADLITFSTGHVNVAFDPDTFSFSKDEHSFGGIGSVDVSPSLVSYGASGNGVVVDFQELMSLYATSYTNFSPESLVGNFNAYFNITPQAGYAITGYTVSFDGTYSIETPGTVSVSSTLADFSASSGSGAMHFSAAVAGAAAPALQGTLNATGDITTVQVFDGYQQVFDHYESVLDYCDTVEPYNCYYHDEAVYRDEAVYHDETDLGEATLTLRTINVQAHVVAVPEPGGWAMLVTGLPMAGWWLRRRARLAGQAV